MKATELIKHLQSIVDEHGDLPACIACAGFEKPPVSVNVYDPEGNYPSETGKAPHEVVIWDV